MFAAVASSTVPVTRRVLSTLPSRAAIRRSHLGQASGRLPVRTLGPLVSTEVAIVSLAAAHARADGLWEGAVKNGSQWSDRQRHVAALHTLVYQLLTELAGRHARTVAIDADLGEGARCTLGALLNVGGAK